jgi:hypothetical protein
MRPQADVDLLGLGDLLNTGRRSSQQRAEFAGLVGGEVANRKAVPERLDEQGADTQGPTPCSMTQCCPE